MQVYHLEHSLRKQPVERYPKFITIAWYTAAALRKKIDGKYNLDHCAIYDHYYMYQTQSARPAFYF